MYEEGIHPPVIFKPCSCFRSPNAFFFVSNWRKGYRPILDQVLNQLKENCVVH